MLLELKKLLGGRTFRLAASLCLLVMSVLMTAELLGIRTDPRELINNSRKTLAESLAVQLSVLAEKGDPRSIDLSVQAAVERNDDVLAAALVRSDGAEIASYGDLGKLDLDISQSTSSLMSVPIFDGDQPWGMAQIAFDSTDLLVKELQYMSFVIATSMGVFLLFLSRVLMMLNPSRAVPGRVSSAFSLFSEGVIILDDQLRIVLGNEAAAEIAGAPADELVGTTLDEWNWRYEDDWQPPWQTALATGMKITDMPAQLTVSDQDEPRMLMLSCAMVGNESEGKRGVLVTLNDMTAIEQRNRDLATTLGKLRDAHLAIRAKNRELEDLATRDPMTGLANRRALLDHFQREFDQAHEQQTPLACVIVDIDKFKSINDNFGHTTGDDVIRAVAGSLNQNTRAQDHVGRYGGEEFVVVLPGLDADGAVALAEQLRLGVQKLGYNRALEVDRLSASFGVAIQDAEVDTVASLIDRADQALYLAKNSGRDQVQLWQPGLDSMQPEETRLLESEGQTRALELTRLRVQELENIVEQRTRELIQMREFDALTGIPNRTLFLQRVDSEIQRADRMSTTVGVLSLEIRDLGQVGATYGHENTDRLIVEVVSRLQEGLRRTDVVSDITGDFSMSRITSNEFGVLLSDLSESAQAMSVVTRLRRLLSEPFLIEGNRLYLGASMGVSLYPQGGQTASDLLDQAGNLRAQAALKPDKFSHALDSELLDKRLTSFIALESDLHDALKNNELEVYYQPKFDLHKRMVCGFESLIRWKHAERGYIAPPDFISVAENNGLITKISDFVLDQSLSHLHQCQHSGWPEMKLAFNISPAQLRDRYLVDHILERVDRHDIESSCIEVELTETSIIESRHRARIALGQLRSAGLAISIDDFGTGYTSLSLLADLPLDIVKIDRSFISDMHQCGRSAAIVESVINMAHALGLRVIGEGVETNGQIEMLTRLGCNEIQGYLIGKPMPAEAFMTFLARQSPAERPRRAS